jgi:hypothetical protein
MGINDWISVKRKEKNLFGIPDLHGLTPRTAAMHVGARFNSQENECVWIEIVEDHFMVFFK